MVDEVVRSSGGSNRAGEGQGGACVSRQTFFLFTIRFESSDTILAADRPHVQQVRPQFGAAGTRSGPATNTRDGDSGAWLLRTPVWRSWHLRVSDRMATQLRSSRGPGEVELSPDSVETTQQ